MADLTLEAENTSNEVGAAPKDYLLLGLKGFILNIANPAVIFYWLSILSLAAQSVPDNTKIQTHGFYYSFLFFWALTLVLMF